MEYKLIRTEYIESVSGGDKEIITELVGLFRSQAGEFSAEMRLLLERKDYFSLGMLAHKAKSSVAIMGMNDLAVMLKNFELEAKQSLNTGMYASYISRFESETTDAIKELEDFTANI